MTDPLSIRRPRTVLLVAFLVALAAGAGIPSVRFETDLRSLVGDDSSAARMFFDLQDHGAGNEMLFLTVAGAEPADLDAAIRHAGVLRAGLEASPAVKSVEAGLSPTVIERFREYATEHLFLLLPPEQVRLALERLSGPGLAKAASEARVLVESAAPLSTIELLIADPFSLRELIAVPGADRMPRYRDGFLVSEDGCAVLLVLKAHAPPTDGEETRRFLAGVRGALAECSDRQPPGVTVDLAGGHLFAEGAESRVREDILRTLVPSVVAVALLFWLFFRTLSGMLIVGAPVVLALAVTMGAVGWTGIRITPVAAAFCALLVGLGVDFGIHLLVSIQVESRGGAHPREAIARAVTGVRRGIVLGGITTAGAVTTLVLADLPGLASLGLLLAIGVLVATVGALTVSVALAAILPRSTTGHGGTAFARLGGWLVEHRPIVRGGLIALVLALVATFSVAGLPILSADPGALRPADDEPTAAIRRLQARFPRLSRVDLVAWRGTDLDAGLTALAGAGDRLRERGLVRDWSGPDTILPPVGRQRENLELLAAFGVAGFEDRAFEALRREGFETEPFRPAIEKLGRALGVGAHRPAADLASPVLQPVAQRFLVDTGTDHLLVAFYREADGEHAEIREAIAEEGLPVVATGPRSLLRGIADRVGAEFRWIPLLVIATVVMATLIGFRRPRLSLLSVTPVVLGMAFTLALMVWLRLDFNLINIGLIPMVLGLGVDDGIQFVNRLRHEGDRPLSSTYRHVGGAILLTTLTTCAAFGSLALSTSPGLRSMGYLVSLGAISCCAVTLLALPALLPGGRSDS